MNFIKLALCSLALVFTNANAVIPTIIQSGLLGNNSYHETREYGKHRHPKARPMRHPQAKPMQQPPEAMPMHHPQARPMHHPPEAMPMHHPEAGPMNSKDMKKLNASRRAQAWKRRREMRKRI